MVIQNLNANIVLPNRNLQSNANQKIVPQRSQFDAAEIKNNQEDIAQRGSLSPVTSSVKPATSTSSVLDTQRQSKFLETAATFFNPTINPDKTEKNSALRAYDKIAEFEELQQLSNLIGIDVQV